MALIGPEIPEPLRYGQGSPMTTGLPRKIVRLLAATFLLTGCAQSNPLLARRTNVGTLKASVSRLEFQNEQLRRETAQLEAENREIENRLVQEEAFNGQLQARLDDARNVISRRGDDAGSLSRNLDPRDADEPTGSRTVPAARSNRTRRKPPFARIPGWIDVLPPSDIEGEPDEFHSDRASGTHDLQGHLDDNRWLPIARGTSDVIPQTR